MFRKSLALSSRHPRGVGHFTGGFLVTYLLSRKAIFLPLICPTCQTETAATRGSRLSQEHTKWAIVGKIRLAEKYIAR